MKRRFRWEVVPPNPNPCPECDGCGSEWKLRRDGQPDRRFRWPLGPCRKCGGSGRASQGDVEAAA